MSVALCSNVMILVSPWYVATCENNYFPLFEIQFLYFVRFLVLFTCSIVVSFFVELLMYGDV